MALVCCFVDLLFSKEVVLPSALDYFLFWYCFILVDYLPLLSLLVVVVLTVGNHIL